MKKFDNALNSIIKSLRLKPELSDDGKKLKYIDDPNYDLILETSSVFRFNVFKRFIDYIESIPEYEIPKILSQDDMKLLGLNVNKFKKKDAEIKDKDLCIIKFDFLDDSEKNRRNFIRYMDVIDPLADSDNVKFINRCKGIMDTLKAIKAGGAYMKFQNEMGVLFYNTNISENLKSRKEEIVYHELIHYLQDVTGNGQPDIESIIEHNYGIDAKAGSKQKFLPIQVNAKTSFSIDNMPSKVIGNLLNEKDVVAYINNIALLFQKNGATAKEALEVVNSIIKEANAREGEDRKKVVRDLAKKISNDIPLLKGIKTEALVLALIAVYKQHRTLLKKTIGNYLQRQ